MAPGKWASAASQAAIAAASDGSVLLNVVELLSEDLRARLSKQLGSAPSFIGIALNQSEAADVVARLDDAAAEASAQLLGNRTAKRRKAGATKARRAKRR